MTDFLLVLVLMETTALLVLNAAYRIPRAEKPKAERESTPEEPEARRKSVDEGIDNLMTYSLDVAKETRRGREEWP